MIFKSVPYRSMSKSQYMAKYDMTYAQATAVWAKLEFLGLAHVYRSETGVYKIQPLDVGLVFSALAEEFSGADMNKLYAFSRRWVTYSILHGKNNDMYETIYSVVYSLKADYRSINCRDIFGENMHTVSDRASKLLIMKVV